MQYAMLIMKYRTKATLQHYLTYTFMLGMAHAGENKMDEHHYTALDQDMHNNTSLCLDRGTPAMHVTHSTWK